MKKVLCPISLNNNKEELLSIEDILARNYKPFFIAVQKGRIDVVRQLLDLGIDPNVSEGLALCLASEGGKVEIVSLLLDKGADVNASGGRPLCKALSYKRWSVAELLLERGADVNCCESRPLYLAVIGANLKMIKLLLSRGADIWGNAGTYMKPGIIFYEAINTYNIGIFKELIFASKQASNQNIPSPRLHRIMEDLLLYSIQRGFKKATKLILKEYKLDLWALNSALSEAITLGDLDIIEKLVSLGARCAGGIEIAIRKKHWDVVLYLIKQGYYCDPNRWIGECVESSDLVELFLNQGVSKDVMQSAFKQAVEKGYRESVDIFLKHGVEPWPEIVPKLVKMRVGIFSL